MKQRNNFYLLLIVMAFILSIFIVLVPSKTALVFYEERTDNIAGYLPIQKDETFEIIFVHSIHLTDVVEKYKVVADNELKQFEMIFEEFGIGMPSTVKEDEEFVYEDGKYHIKNMNNIFSSFNIRNGKTVSEHRLVWYGKDGEMHIVFFNDYFTPGAWFTVKVNKISLLQTWNGVKIRD